MHRWPALPGEASLGGTAERLAVPAALHQGTTGLLIGYGLAVLGLVMGFDWLRRRCGGCYGPCALGIPTMFGAAALWGIILWAGAHSFINLSKTATELFGVVFLLVSSAIVGTVFARVKSNVQHQRGTRLVEQDCGNSIW